ncbi:TetR/AcrR family transcriptional regulator [Leucobacter weissii]|uniref:TetR/AcrR family transcriptional regulator n=1 Tax=Leucobacter weissii TaxID=1983706 RepID=A0A939MLM0_9MICO|nr:TetR/AcrR family transcriptional regulator [Leucobacter weissii]MBO1900892.1 TetR/AcrR family transcriptional regulator [Leucobacter weissii]
MDPRFTRTADSLRETALRLAAERPVEQIGVSELADAAGVTRRTFYNHYRDPAALVTALLGSELETVANAFERRLEQGRDLRESWLQGDHELAAHLLRRAEIYGAGIRTPSDHMSPALERLLSDHFERGVTLVLRRSGRHRGEAPLVARFIGHGIVGALEAWLLEPGRDPDRLAAALFLSVPEWVTLGA